MKSRKHNSLFVRFAIPYVVILSIQFSAAFIIYNYSIRTMENYFLDTNMKIFEYISNSLDKNIVDITNIAYQISTDTKVRSFQFYDGPFERDNVWHSYDLERYLYDYSNTNSFVYDYYVVYRGSKTVVKPHEIHKYNEFYPCFYKYGDYNGDAWFDFLFSKRYTAHYLPQETVITEGQTKQLITCLYSLGQVNNSYAVLVVNIDAGRFLDSLSAVNIGTRGSAYIQDANGEILCKLSGKDSSGQIVSGPSEGVSKVKLAGEEMLFTSYISKTNGWRFTAIQSPEAVLHSVTIMRITILTGLLSALFASLLLGMWFARRNANPLKKIFDGLFRNSEHTTAGNIYEAAEKAVTGLFDKNRQLREEVERQVPVLQMGYFSRLLHGEFYDKSTACEYARQVGVHANARSYAAIIIEKAKLPEAELHDGYLEFIRLEEVIKKSTPAEYYIVKLNINRIVLVGALNEPDEHVCRANIQKLAQNIKARFNGIKICIGGIYHSIFNIFDSYNEAQNVAEFSKFVMSKDSIEWYTDMPKSLSEYYYDIETENRLLNIIRAGDLKQLKSTLDNIYRENFESRDLSHQMIKLLWYELYGTAVKLMHLMEVQASREIQDLIKARLNAMESAGGLGEFSEFAELFTDVGTAIKNKKCGQDEAFKSSIMQFLAENYRNPDLCLESLAESFGVSVSFLSTFFKEQIGQNFYTMLEGIRMSEAERLLSETNMRIKDVIKQVGYSTLNTFGRAFKRVNGVSPSEYRTMIRENKHTDKAF